MWPKKALSDKHERTRKAATSRAPAGFADDIFVLRRTAWSISTTKAP